MAPKEATLEKKVNIVILCMESEIEVTLLTLNALLININSNTIISVLLNGSSNKLFEKKCRSHKSIKYYESPENLGVAGGRNFLFQTKECCNCDVVISLDNDLLPPFNFVDKAVRRLYSDENQGIIGSTILKFRDFKKSFGDQLENFRPLVEGDSFSFNDDELTTRIDENQLFSLLDHAGTNKDWCSSYINSKELEELHFFNREEKEHRFITSLAFDKSIIGDIKLGNKVEVANIGGGNSIFKRSLLDKIGPYNDIFSPYGFEDVDFSIRTIKAGFKNYTYTDLYTLHGTDIRHKKREESLENKKKKWTNDFRVRSLIKYFHGLDYKMEVGYELFCRAYSVKPELRSEKLLADYKGFEIANTQIETFNRPFSHKGYTKFLMLTRSRTGSNWLMSMLGNHKNIYAVGEIFGSLNNYPDLNFRFNQVFKNHEESTKAAGFKIFYNSPSDYDGTELWKILKSQTDIKIIHLKRKDIVRSIVSAAIMDKTGKQNLVYGNGISTNDKRIKLDPDYVASEINKTKSWHKRYDKLFESHHILNVYYEDLNESTEQTLVRLQNFLSVPIDETIYRSSNLKRQNPESLKDLISNYSEIKEVVNNIK